MPLEVIMRMVFEAYENRFAMSKLFLIRTIIMLVALAGRPEAHISAEDCGIQSWVIDISSSASQARDMGTPGATLQTTCYGQIIALIAQNFNRENQRLAIELIPKEKPLNAVNSAAIMEITVDQPHKLVLRVFPQAQPELFQQSQVLSGHPAVEMLMAAADHTPVPMLADFITGMVLYSVGDCESAHSYLTRGRLRQETGQAQSDPIRASAASFYLGNCQLMGGQYASAEEHFRQSLIMSDVVPIRMQINISANLAWTYLQLQQPDEAFTIMDRLIEDLSEFPSNKPLAEALSRRAQLHALVFQYDEAVADMNLAVQLDASNPALYVMRGQMVLLTYEWDAVLADYDKAIALDRNYADAYFYRGVLYYTQGPREKAFEDFSQYLRLAPDGSYAVEARQYAESIRSELESLSG